MTNPMRLEETKAHIPEAIDLMLKSGRELTLNVYGSSMGKVIVEGDKVSLEPCPPEKIQIGDIALFMQNGNAIVHRIIKRKIDNGRIYFCQKGDGLSGWSWIDSSQVVGRVKRIFKGDNEINVESLPYTNSRRLFSLFISFKISFIESMKKCMLGR